MTPKTRERLIGVLLVVALVVAHCRRWCSLAGTYEFSRAAPASLSTSSGWKAACWSTRSGSRRAGDLRQADLDFVPYLYTPLYPALLALLSLVFPLGYLLGRVVSLLALFAALVLLGALVVREARGLARVRRLLAALIAVAGAAAFVAAFDLTGGFYDLVRADSLVLALEALTLWLMVRGSTWKSAAVAGLAIAAAFFTKQTASIMGVGLGIGLLIVNWRRGLVYGAVAAAALAAGVGLLVKTSDGWFWTYISSCTRVTAIAGA